MNKNVNNQIITEARTWLNTPFHLNGRIKQVGVDCIGLIIGIASALNIKTKDNRKFTDIDEGDYSLQTNIVRLIDKLDASLIRQRILKPGNIVLFSDHNIKHIALLGKCGDSYTMIHSCIKSDKVVEHRLNQDMKNKIFKIYKFKE